MRNFMDYFKKSDYTDISLLKWNIYNEIYILSIFFILVAQNLQSIIQNHIDNLQSSSSRSSLPENPHDQAALMILMAAQHQADKEGACLLQNQEVVEVLQNLVCSRDDEGVTAASDQSSSPQDPYAQILKLPGLQMVLGEQSADSSQVTSYHNKKTQ